MHGARLYARYLGASLRSQMQYRLSLAMQLVGHFLVTGVEFVGVWVLFDRFGSLRGWTLAEVAVFFGIIGMGFAIADAVGRGFDIFPGMVRRGDFDRLLLRPRSTALQIAGLELTIKRAGRFLQGFVILLWAMHAQGLGWTFWRVGLLFWILIGIVAMFYGLMVISATISFWTTESLELMNTLTYGGVETAQYPMAIYREGFRRFFTFVVPLACVAYFPIVALLGREDPLGSPFWFQIAAPGAGVLFMTIALKLWSFGERRYTSTGS